MNEPRNSTVHVAEEKIAGKGDMHKVKSQGITEATFVSRGDRVPGNHMLMPTLKNAIPNGHAEISQIQRYHRAYNKHILFIIYRSKVGSDRTIVELHR